MADNSVRADTPDPKKYHQNIGGIPGTMLPRSGKDGQSLAFDPNKPMTVIVDPGEEGGGFELNISDLSKSKNYFNSAAVRSEVLEDPSTFYRELSHKAAEELQLKGELKSKLQEKLKEPTMPEPIKPLESLPNIGSPKTDKPSEAEMERRAAAFDGAGAIEQLLAEERAKADQLKEKQRAWAAMAHDSGETPAHLQQSNNEMVEIRNSLSKQGEAINALIGVLHRMDEKPVTQSPPAREEVLEATKADVEDPEKSAFDGLQIPFLTGQKPTRPQYETYFEMGKLGTMAARYHAVIPGQDCVALVYDTRFEDGFQYLPPNLGEEKVNVSVPKLDKATFVCSSLGLHWSLGCMDIVILIKHGDDE